MSGRWVLEYARDVCRQLDEGRAVIAVRRAAAVLLVPAALAPACMDNGGLLYGIESEEYECTDGVDDDYDGFTDCDDDDCAGNELCLGCDDGQDNDGDGLADCNDPDCDQECP